MAMALQNCCTARGGGGAAMATTIYAAPQVSPIGRASSPPCCSSSTSSSEYGSYVRGRLPGSRRSSSHSCSSSAGKIQLGGRIGRIAGVGHGIFKGSGGLSRMCCSTQEEYDKRVVLLRAFGRKNGDGDPLYFVGDDGNGEGPIELPPREVEIDPFAIPDASPAQIVASIVLMTAITVLGYRALRKRAARSKEMQFRSGGINPKSIKEEAKKTVLGSLTTKAPEVPTPLPSPVQTFFGAAVAGVIALGLYKFTATVETGFSVKAVSQDYSIRNLTITVRTIITGLCYLATFVFAANSIGLTLYAFQLLLGIGVSEPANPPDSIRKEESKTEEKLETEDLSEK
ncbi:unnamed protein product [Calypogeia fissa]